VTGGVQEKVVSFYRGVKKSFEGPWMFPPKGTPDVAASFCGISGCPAMKSFRGNLLKKTSDILQMSDVLDRSRLLHHPNIRPVIFDHFADTGIQQTGLFQRLFHFGLLGRRHGKQQAAAGLWIVQNKLLIIA